MAAPSGSRHSLSVGQAADGGLEAPSTLGERNSSVALDANPPLSTLLVSVRESLSVSELYGGVVERNRRFVS
jgi:hypothetical protein